MLGSHLIAELLLLVVVVLLLLSKIGIKVLQSSTYIPTWRPNKNGKDIEKIINVCPN